MINTFLRRSAGVAFAAALLAGCSGNTPMQTAIPAGESSTIRHSRPTVTSNYIYVTDRKLGELLVYPAHVANPSPIRTITGFNVLEGVATDTSGNVYVSDNTSGVASPAVIEYNSGATSIVHIFSAGLHHPIDVATGPGGDVYITDDNGPTSRIYEYAPTGGSPIASSATFSGPQPRGIAVDSGGDVFVDTTGIADVYPPISQYCLAYNKVFEYSGGLTATPQHIDGVEQPWGLALDGTTLYESDYCLNKLYTVAPPYTLGSRVFTPISTSESLYIKISSDRILTIPNASNPNVTEYDLTGRTSPITITTGLSGPISAAAGP
jgi:hypothetical protein